MKVIRSFYDFYDGALSTFNEQVPLYIREEIMCNTKNTEEFRKTLPSIGYIYATPKKDPNDHIWLANPFRQEIHTFIIGFCGKVYPIYTTLHRFAKSKAYVPIIACVSIDELKTTFDNVETSRYWSDKTTVFENINEIINKPNWVNIFIELDAPVFLYDQEKGFTKNPCLKDFGFQKLWHPYNAAQEIEMFMNNILCKNSTPPMPVGNDKVIAESKGFDKYSFRTPPTKK